MSVSVELSSEETQGNESGWNDWKETVHRFGKRGEFVELGVAKKKQSLEFEKLHGWRVLGGSVESWNEDGRG